MAVYKYRILLNRGEEFTEEGVVVAKDEAEAKAKLRPLKYRHLHLKKLSSLSGFFRQFTADVR